MSVGAPVPYKLVWLDSCHQETLLPGTPWNKIRDVLNNRLATKVKAYCGKSQRDATKCLFDLLGRHFVETYLSDEAYHKQDTTETQYASQMLQEEAYAWLQTAIKEVASSLGLNWKETNTYGGKEASRDVLEFVGFTQQVVYRGLEHELAAVERRKNQSVESSSRKHVCLLGASYQSETIGLAISALLRHHPSQLGRVCEQLYGRQLPNSLRQVIWIGKLQKPCSDTITPQEDCEHQFKQATTQFESTLLWGLKELGLSNPVHSPIEGVIKHTVTEAYKFSSGLEHEFVTDVHVKQAVKVLNMLYVHSRSYEPQYALLVFPLISAFQSEDLNPDELSKKLALSLHLLLKNCFPSRLQCFSMADHVIQRLHSEDEELYDHLVSNLQRDISLDAQEFLVNFINTEKEQALLQERAEERFESLPSDSKHLLCHPIIFMRKWIFEGFVGALGVHAVMLVWDQCFMSSWKPTVMENACLVMLQLLREKLMKAGGHSEVKKVLLHRPSELFAIDIQWGLSYLENGGVLQDVRFLRPPTQIPSLSGVKGISHSATAPASPGSSMTEPSSRQSAPSTVPPSQSIELWVERAPSVPMVELTTNRAPFDVYIDEVRFIPDNATMVKVTGRVLDPFWQKLGPLGTPDIEAYPLLDSPARCPKFKYKYTVDFGAEGITTEAMLLLRTYTIDVNTGELIVIGNSTVRLFIEDNEEWRLNAGGHQLPLKHVLPSTVSKLTEEAFDEIAKLPVSSILIRLLPHYEEFVEPTNYSSGYYSSEKCKPNESEWRIFHKFQSSNNYPPTVREALHDLKEGENDEEGFDPTNDQAVLQFYKQRTTKHLLMRQPAKPTDLTKVVQYDKKQGLSITVEQAHGLPNNCFVNVFLHVSSGVEKALIKHRDFSSYQKSPKWIDPAIVIKPSLDEMTSLVIRLYSLDAVYTPRADRAGPGTVEARRGRSLILEPLGWTVLQLFTKEYVNAGIYYLPLFEGSPSSSFLEFLSSHPADVSLQAAINQDIHTLLGTSSLTVRLWDAHYSLEECIPLPSKEEYLFLGKPQRYRKTMQTTSGKLISDTVLQSLTRQERKQGVAGERYNAEKDFYEEAMNTVFSELMVDVLLESGLGPLM